MRDKLIELITENLVVETWDNGEFIDHKVNVEEIVDCLLASGVIVPPCKVGDTVYKIVKFCEKNTGLKEFYRPSVDFEENCPYLEPQSWYDDCDRCTAVEDYDEGCYCTLDLKIHCDTCKSRLAIQKEKFTYGMMTRVFNTPMFNKNTADEDILYLTREEAEEAEQALKGGAQE